MAVHGKNSQTHNTINDKTQKMVLPNGTPKSMKLVSQNRVTYFSKMKADDI